MDNINKVNLNVIQDNSDNKVTLNATQDNDGNKVIPNIANAHDVNMVHARTQPKKIGTKKGHQQQ